MIYLSIEGHNFSGKTTAIQHLEREYGFVPVPELDTFVSSEMREKIAHTIPATVEESRTVIDASIDSAIAQSRVAKGILRSGKHAAGDRSVITIVSICQVGFDLGLPLDSAYALDTAAEAIEKESVAAPDALIIMHAANRAVHEKRVEKRGKLPLEPLNWWEVAESVFEASMVAASKLMPGVQIVPVESTGAIEDIMQIKPVVDDLLSQAELVSPTVK